MVAAHPTPPNLALEIHVWRAGLNGNDWPRMEELPAVERERAERIVSAAGRSRWIASRWALRTALAGYLEEEPASIELRIEPRGKPRLAAASPLRFNLSHSADVALMAVTLDREIGIDVELVGERPLAFYESWVRREAIAKCHGSGLGGPFPSAAVSVSAVDAGPGFAAALAIEGAEAPRLREFALGGGSASPPVFKAALARPRS